MEVMRLIVPSVCGYAIRQLSAHIGTEFDDRQVVDVPLKTEQQVRAARALESQFVIDGLSSELRNGPNAVQIFSCSVVEI